MRELPALSIKDYSSVTTLLKEYLGCCADILNLRNPHESTDLYKKFLYDLTERQYHITHSLIILVPAMQRSNKLKLPISNILRTSVNDFITLLYLLHNDATGANKVVEQLNSAVVKYRVKEYEAMVQSKAINEAEFTSKMQELVDAFPYCFEKRRKLRKNLKTLMAADMLKRLKEKDQGRFELKLRVANRLYYYFSQSAHVSEISRAILHAPTHLDFDLIRMTISLMVTTGDLLVTYLTGSIDTKDEIGKLLDQTAGWEPKT